MSFLSFKSFKAKVVLWFAARMICAPQSSTQTIPLRERPQKSTRTYPSVRLVVHVLWADVAVVLGLGNARPVGNRSRGLEPQLSDRRLSVSDAAEGQDPVNSLFFVIGAAALGV